MGKYENLKKALENRASDIRFVRNEKTTLRILNDAEDTMDWFYQFVQTYNDKPSVKYAIVAEDLADNQQVVYVLPKSVFAGILDILAENESGSPDEITPIFGDVARGIQITRSGVGINTRYTVKVTNKEYTVNLPEDYPNLEGTIKTFLENVAQKADKQEGDLF